MKTKKKLSLPIQILIGLVAGVIVGIMLQTNPDVATKFIKPIGTIFLNLIKLVIVPLVFSSLVVGVADLKDAKQIGKIGLKTFAYFFVTTAFAIIIGLTIANIFDVASGFTLPANQLTFEAKEAPSFIDTLVGIIPANPLEALVNGQMLQIIVFALIIGAGLLYTGEKGQYVFNVFDGLQEAMIHITNGIMKFAPYGVFGLIAPVIAVNGPQVLLPLIKVIALVYLGCFLHAFIVYGGTIAFLTKLPVGIFFKKVFSPWAVAFTTSSSAGTLPIALDTAENELGVSKPIASFVLPLGSTINMDGTAIYQGVCALFIAKVYGLDLTMGQQVTVVLTTVLASVGTAGVPGAGMIMLAMVLQSVGIPVEGIALVAGVDRIFDMIRTSINVLGDITCSVLVAKSEGKLNEEVFKTAKSKN